MARPKKRILLVDANEQRLSARSFVLRTHRYAVFPATTSAEALHACAVELPDLVLIVCPIPDTALLLRHLHTYFPLTRTLLFAEGLKAAPENAYADRVLWGLPPVFDLLDQIRFLCARKPGPLKKPVQPAAVVDALTRRLA